MVTKLVHAFQESDSPAEQFERPGLTAPQTGAGANT
jgi:hypothetical protein